MCCRKNLDETKFVLFEHDLLQISNETLFKNYAKTNCITHCISKHNLVNIFSEDKSPHDKKKKPKSKEQAR